MITYGVTLKQLILIAETHLKEGDSEAAYRYAWVVQDLLTRSMLHEAVVTTGLPDPRANRQN